MSNKVAVVTGGSRGIGAAIAERFAADGYDVVFSYASNEDAAADVASKVEAHGRRAVAVQADGGDRGDCERLIQTAESEFGRLDALVCNAGVYPQGAIGTYDADTLERAFAVNVLGPIHASQKALALMGEGGRIVFIGSAFAERAPFPGISLYASTKAALVGLAKGMSRDLGPRRITVNVVQPGPIDTDLNPADGESADDMRAQLALEAYGQARDVANLVAFLASEGAGNITGTALSVDGGITA